MDWLHTRVEGLSDRRDARKYASNMLRAGFVRHTVNKVTFSEQCYYVFDSLLTLGPQHTPSTQVGPSAAAAWLLLIIVAIRHLFIVR